MAGVETLLQIGEQVYKKCCQYQEDREDISYLAVRISILMGVLKNQKILENSNNAKENSYAGQKMIFHQISKVIHHANRFVDEFQSAGRMKRILKAGHWTGCCQKIFKELDDLIAVLGMSSDLKQLRLLGEIQQAISDRHKNKTRGQVKELKLLQAHLTKSACIKNDNMQTARIPLQELHHTLVVGKGTQKTATTSPSIKKNGPSRESRVASTATTVATTIGTSDEESHRSSLPTSIQRLFENPRYACMMLDETHLKYSVSEDDPSGAFGVVHVGSYLDQPAAVKKLLTKNPSVKAMEEVLEEALLMKTYNFMDSFASVYGVCVIDQTPAIIMERMETDLFQYLHYKDHGDVTSRLAWKLRSALVVSKAVNTLHKLKILHRDLKSPNILVNGVNADVLRITDFGMAKLRKEISTVRKSQSASDGLQLGEHETVGSYPWMAPEIMQAGKYTTMADIFSLGVILWELFTLQEPWCDAISIRSIENAVLGGKRLKLKHSNIPSGMKRILKATWNADPKLRPKASEIATEIEEIASRKGVEESLKLSGNVSCRPKGEPTGKKKNTNKELNTSNPHSIQSQSTLDSYRIASRNGEVGASYNLGLMYSQGQGVPQNFQLAAEYYQAGANGGDAKSQSNLALLYYQGKGVPQNLSLAAKYFRLAADQGDAIGQRNLAALYEGGYGVQKDWQLAKRYYGMAANQGDDTSAERLESLQQMNQAPLQSAMNKDTLRSKRPPPSKSLMRSRIWS